MSGPQQIEAWSVEATSHRNLDPEWHYAGRDVPRLPGLRVALGAGDLMGEGYAPFLPHLDASPATLEATSQAIAAALLGARLDEPDAALVRLGPCTRSRNAARSAVEMAVLDLVARARGISVLQMLGGTPCSLPVLRIIPVKTPERMAEIAAELVAEGYGALKLKATGQPEADLARIAAVRAAVGPQVVLTVDANQAYGGPGAIALEAALRPLDLWSLEQPVPAGERAALAALRRAAVARIEADEGLFNAADLARLLDAQAADGISLKLARSGGLLPSLAMARSAAAAGVHARIGTAFGGPLVTLATAQLAGLHPCAGPAECAEFTHFDDEDHLWPEIVQGRLTLGGSPGLGQIRRVPWQAPWLDRAIVVPDGTSLRS
ncbi:mandelate racemase/muconate lactonizing enzyme family protein [Salipiger manganoxidans]|uniref:mandelate racemase/muconate lactonizing enzyme family protein n=1 Tax=Salipiger marinus TaxID=555512 RepID=UPI001E2B0A39|nr:mandelate racemase/muconate lactonizing enzyme family protein [Salipiger manganoxidans]MCD1619321.1 mandelate racemase/muconate lactonizing enzyme family protein [Salipiger manganoxidans]